jgi:hypothetical protein
LSDASEDVAGRPKLSILHSPLPWPDGMHPADRSAANLRHVMGVISGLDATGVQRIREWIDRACDITARIVLLVHATCPTRSEDLSALVGLADGRASKVRFFVRPLAHWGEELTWVRFDYGEDSPPLLWIAASGNLGLCRPEPHHGHVLLTPDAEMEEQFLGWYSGVEALAIPLSHRTSNIPALVPAHGTMEGRLAWNAYLETCRIDAATPSVDTGADCDSPALSPEHSLKTTPEEIASAVRNEIGLRLPDPLVPIVSQLFQKGFHATLDKTSRIPPLDLPINARFFGIDKVRQRGVISRRVDYSISILDDAVNRELEKHRKAASDILPKFSFALADGNRWMPLASKRLYERELEKAEKGGSAALCAVLGGDTKAFVSSKREVVAKAAQQHYQEFNPGEKIPDEYVGKILEALEARFDKALNGKFVPELSEVGTTFRAPRECDLDSNWAVARRLIASVAEYPRKALKDYNYFFRGLKVEPEKLLEAMNVLDDHIVSRISDRRAEQIAKDELDCLEEIEESELSDRDKCAEIFALLNGSKTVSQILRTLQEASKQNTPVDRPEVATH